MRGVNPSISLLDNLDWMLGVLGLSESKVTQMAFHRFRQSHALYGVFQHDNIGCLSLILGNKETFRGV